MITADPPRLQVRPLGWRPKTLVILKIVWDRFVEAVGLVPLSSVGLDWTGGLRE
jgi:hypothetical protein